MHLPGGDYSFFRETGGSSETPASSGPSPPGWRSAGLPRLLCISGRSYTPTGGGGEILHVKWPSRHLENPRPHRGDLLPRGYWWGQRLLSVENQESQEGTEPLLPSGWGWAGCTPLHPPVPPLVCIHLALCLPSGPATAASPFIQPLPAPHSTAPIPVLPAPRGNLLYQ